MSRLMKADLGWKAEVVIQPFDYPAMPLASAANGGNGNGDSRETAAAPLMWTQLTEPKALLKYTEGELQDRLAAQDQAARRQAAQECEGRLRVELEAAISRERSTLGDVIQQFSRERKTFFERVEVEVVQLALEVARKILHREAEIDPLLLTGVVRAALERLESRSSVRLRVAEEEALKWHEIVNSLGGTVPRPEVAVDSTLAKDCCVLETEVGTTDISLDQQFFEVERGLLDQLSSR